MPSHKNTMLYGVLTVAALLALAQIVSMNRTDQEKTSPAAGTSMLTEKDSEAAPEPSVLGKKASTIGEYTSPAGSETIGFFVEVDSNGTIVSASAEPHATNEISKMRQEAFAAEIPAALVGKKLSELSSIDRVGKSSLTTASFNASLERLKAQM